jgi:hypothetical protein
MLPPCSEPSRRGLETPEGALPAQCRPALTAPARGGVRDLRSGREKACGAVEQEKGTGSGAVRKLLASMATMKERKNARHARPCSRRAVSGSTIDGSARPPPRSERRVFVERAFVEWVFVEEIELPAVIRFGPEGLVVAADLAEVGNARMIQKEDA